MNLLDVILARNFASGNMQQTLFDYGGGDDLIYIGYAKSGAQTSDPQWTVVKFSYDASERVASSKVSTRTIKWDDRGTATYA